jgi:hypothetical protein
MGGPPSTFRGSPVSICALLALTQGPAPDPELKMNQNWQSTSECQSEATRCISLMLKICAPVPKSV